MVEAWEVQGRRGLEGLREEARRLESKRGGRKRSGLRRLEEKQDPPGEA